MEKSDPNLSLEDLTRLIRGDADEQLQERLTAVLRSDPRFTEHFAVLDRLATEAGTEDLLQAYIRHEEFEYLLAAPDEWEDPAEILDDGVPGLFRVDYRQLLSIAEARLKTAKDPEPIHALRDRLREAEREPARHAVFAVAEALEYLSETTADQVVAEVRKGYRHRSVN